MKKHRTHLPSPTPDPGKSSYSKFQAILCLLPRPTATTAAAIEPRTSHLALPNADSVRLHPRFDALSLQLFNRLVVAQKQMAFGVEAGEPPEPVGFSAHRRLSAAADQRLVEQVRHWRIPTGPASS